MNLTTERMSYAGHPRPEEGKGFGGLLEQGLYINYLHGLNFLCKEHLTKNMKILELGCFYGSSSELFSEYSDDVTCVDLEYYPDMQKLVESKGITFHKSDSIEFLKSIKKGEYDLIYIDTTHDYGRTREEILIAYENLKEGQYISGHDYNSHGVSGAVLSVFEYPDIKIYLDSSWIIKKTSETKLK
jgi:hypothetical protein